MASKKPHSKPPAAEPDVVSVADVLGCRRWLRGDLLQDPLALHDRLARGMPAGALRHFAGHFPLLARDPAFDRVLGAPQTLNEGPRSGRNGRLSSHASGQLWQLAVILLKAAPLLGGADAAERWLIKPAIGLGQRRPLDLLETPTGHKLVTDLLIQLEYGVYV